ncbi:MAG: TonB family protein [Polyangiaceae bacterium]
MTLDKQRPLGAAGVDYARYLNDMHNRIHPVFMGFLESLDKLPPESPLHDKKLVTRLEIVLGPDGRILKMGVVKTSGNEDMDALALEAVDRAAPFAPIPTSIASTDGNLYVHWELHRDGVFGCSTMNARPFRLDAGPIGALH